MVRWSTLQVRQTHCLHDFRVPRMLLVNTLAKNVCYNSLYMLARDELSSQWSLKALGPPAPLPAVVRSKIFAHVQGQMSHSKDNPEVSCQAAIDTHDLHQQQLSQNTCNKAETIQSGGSTISAIATCGQSRFVTVYLMISALTRETQVLPTTSLSNPRRTTKRELEGHDGFLRNKEYQVENQTNDIKQNIWDKALQKALLE
eukprot:1550854-Amphidinium_carterae.1